MTPVSEVLGAAADRLCAAAEAFGDDSAAAAARFKAWRDGDPIPAGRNRDLENALISAARAYATSTRKRRSRQPNTGEASNVR